MFSVNKNFKNQIWVKFVRFSNSGSYNYLKTELNV